MSTEYVTVYEIAHRSQDWRFACVGFIPLIAGAVIVWGKRRYKWTQPNWFLAIFCCIFGAFWIVAVGFTTLQADADAFTPYQKGDYQTVEGTVTDFDPMPYGGHKDECFSVQYRRFCYSDYDMAPGFHNATSHGGPIRAGLPVRIAYRDGRILKLEVPKGEAPTPAQSAAISAEGERQWQHRAESDPFERKLNIAATFTAMCWTLWGNLQWKRAMRFWLKPPYRPWIERVFRVIFAFGFLGAFIRLIRQLYSHPLSKQDLGPTVRIAAVMCVAVTIMSAFVLWTAQRNDAKMR